MNNETPTQEASVEGGVNEFRTFEVLGSMSLPIFTHNDLHAEISSAPLQVESIGLEVSIPSSDQTAQTNGETNIVVATGQQNSGDNVESIPVPVVDTNTSFITDHASEFAHGLKVEDALNYLEKVRCRYILQPHVYLNFIEVMREFKTQSIDTLGVVHRVNDLLQESPDLITEFKVFLPEDHRFSNINKVTAPAPIANYPVAVQEQPFENANVGVDLAMQSTRSGSCSADKNGGGGAYVYWPVAVTESSTPVSHSSHKSHPPPVAPRRLNQPKRHSLENAPAYRSNQQQYEQMLFRVMHHDNGGSYSSTELGNHPDYGQTIDYVNEIKARLSSEEYQQFLEILSVYRKQQRQTDSSVSESNFTEHEIYIKISKLFEGHLDLMEEFVRFVPTASSVLTPIVMGRMIKQKSPEAPSSNVRKTTIAVRGRKQGRPTREKAPLALHQQTQEEHSSGKILTPAAIEETKRKLKLVYDQKPKNKSLGFDEFAEFLNKVQRFLEPSSRYKDFLRVLLLHNKDVLSQSELVQTVAVLLGDESEMLTWFKNFIKPVDAAGCKFPSDVDEPENVASAKPASKENCNNVRKEVVDIRELDPSTCRRLGQSYCQIPKHYQLPKCSGRTRLCDEVLNDEWLSVPLWTENAACISSNKKLPCVERTNQIEDQRFELDFVIQTNADAIKYLRVVESSMKKMSPDELDKFQLDERMGSQSTIHLRAIRRIYGEVAAPEIIEGVMRCPKVAVPIVLKRLQGKDDEWRGEQKKFNKIWREELERCHHKNASIFKQRDNKAMKSKSLIAEIQTKSD